VVINGKLRNPDKNEVCRVRGNFKHGEPICRALAGRPVEVFDESGVDCFIIFV
jgi:hypothetical protein